MCDAIRNGSGQQWRIWDKFSEGGGEKNTISLTVTL